ncbi:MAG: hypothetical protein IJ649_00620 [Oscillospiraceae bacterium]|nr:hypothetical protein [Oscillospiraceae bacterium]
MAAQVYINQQPAGTLSVTQDGLYTVFEARANADGLVRLWAYGGGKSAYLGIMEPTDSGLYLRRRLSRRELAAFPDPIEFASDREGEDLHNIIDSDGNGDRQVSAAEEEEARPNSLLNQEPEADQQQKGETDCLSCPWPAAVPEEGLLWYRRPDGSLVSFDGVSSLLAIPAELRAPDARMTERVIEGKKYLVFRY